MPRITLLLDDAAKDIVEKVAGERFDGNQSMAARFIIKDWEYIAVRYSKLGKRPTEEERAKWDGAGGG